MEPVAIGVSRHVVQLGTRGCGLTYCALKSNARIEERASRIAMGGDDYRTILY